MSRRKLTERQSVELIAALVMTTTGWNDDSVDGTVEMMTRQWSDELAAVDAINEVIQTWTERTRPPWAVLALAYRNAVQRRALSAPALPASVGQIVPFDEGIKIAYRSYCKEVKRQGKTPKPFSGFLTLVERATG